MFLNLGFRCKVPSSLKTESLMRVRHPLHTLKKHSISSLGIFRFTIAFGARALPWAKLVDGATFSKCKAGLELGYCLILGPLYFGNAMACPFAIQKTTNSGTISHQDRIA
jgi:hypothetical protein